MTTALVTGGSNGPMAGESAGFAMNGPLTLDNQGAAPAASSAGPILTGLSGQSAYVNPQGLTGILVGSQGALAAAGTAITTTTSETVLQSLALPAGDPAVGSVYKMAGWGVFSSTASPGSTVFTSRLGGVSGTSLAATANITLGASLTNAQFKYEAVLDFYSATSVQCLIELLINSAAGGAASAYLVAATAAVAVATSTAKAWVLDVTPGASGNSIQLLGAWSERIA